MMRILFVDDDQRLLAGLRRSLRNLADEWAMTFADSAADAMRLLPISTFDVVVTDLAMPDVDGYSFLQFVIENAPNAGRVVFSGQNEAVNHLASAPVAHVVLAKPADTSMLVDAVRMAYRARGAN